MNKIELLALKEQVHESVVICQKAVLTTKEASLYMGLSMSHLYKLTSTNQIPHYKPMGKVCYFNREELETWLQSNRVATESEINQKAKNYCNRKGGAL